MMRVRIGVQSRADAADEVLASLFRWLQHDDQLVGRVELKLVPRLEPDAQGGVFDLINVVVNDGVGLGGLILSYATWRQAHRSRTTVSFERDGVTIQVADASAETIQLITEALSDQASGSAEPAQEHPNEPEAG
jgi:hypothetical protein